MEFRKLPYLKLASPTLRVKLDKSILPIKRPMSGLIKFLTSDFTIAVKAAPIITPTAKSITFPRAINCLNSLSILLLLYLNLKIF